MVKKGGRCVKKGKERGPLCKKGGRCVGGKERGPLCRW